MSDSAQTKEINAFAVFTDLKGFSSIKQTAYPEFISVQRNVFERIQAETNEALVFNTWGDACFAVFEAAAPAVRWMLKYREAFREVFRTSDFENIKRPLVPRIAGHFGEFTIFGEKLRSKDAERLNVLGHEINTAARVEPVTRPDEVYVTKAFKEQAETKVGDLNVTFEEVGEIPLAKGFGEAVVFRLRTVDDRKQTLDHLAVMKLAVVLPGPPPMSKDEEVLLGDLKSAGSLRAFSQLLPDEGSWKSGSADYQIKLADICKSRGRYQVAIDLLDVAQSYAMNVDDLTIHPFQHDPALLKLRANCLTRLGRYEEAADLMYGLWKTGKKDSDTLSMLAAQYKRRAVGADSEVAPDRVNLVLLRRARDLYIEAFRRKFSDYYPAINAAYLDRILEHLTDSGTGKGIKLAQHIYNSWRDTREEEMDWWLASTLAEAELLQEDYDESRNLFSEALSKYSPDEFERAATRDQISLYGFLTGRMDKLVEIISVLRNVTETSAHP